MPKITAAPRKRAMRKKALLNLRNLPATSQEIRSRIIDSFHKITIFADYHKFVLSFDAIMKRTVFTTYQQQVLNLMSHVDSDEQMQEINDLLSAYFARKAVEAADQLWDEGKIDSDTVESWKNEHMRKASII